MNSTFRVKKMNKLGGAVVPLTLKLHNGNTSDTLQKN